jgi:hypothetical protein
LADHLPIFAESGQPQAMAEQHDVFRTGGILSGQKNRTYQRLDPQE